MNRNDNFYYSLDDELKIKVQEDIHEYSKYVKSC
jgi:hypothetical protein